jgi:hypothetical protein
MKRKASPEPAPKPAPKPRRFIGLGSATPTALDDRGRRILVRRYDLVFYAFEDDIEKVLGLEVKETDSLGSVYSKIEGHMGCEVELYQTIKKNTYKLDRDDTPDDCIDFACPVHVKRVCR